MAAKQGSFHFIRQSLGHALYTANEIEKRKFHMHSPVGRKKRCSFCAGAMTKFMNKIEKAIGKTNFSKFIGDKDLAKATLMFAIDDTGSMSEEIQAAKDIAEYIVKYPRPQLQVDYILSPFNDPGTRICFFILHRPTISLLTFVTINHFCFGSAGCRSLVPDHDIKSIFEDSGMGTAF